jgi:hypothetical protein
MSDRTFNIAGFSTLSGQRKVRFANGTVEARAKILERNGHVDIDLRELPNAMSKAEAMTFLEVTAEDPRAPKGVQAAAAKAKNAAKITKVIEIVKDATRAAAKVEEAEEVSA